MTDSAPPPPRPSFEPQTHILRAEDFFRSPSLISGFLRLCFYLTLVYVIGYGMQRLSSLFVGREFSPFAPRRFAAAGFAGLASTLAAAWIMSLLEKRSFAAYGLPLRSAFGKLFWLGAIFGLVEISAVVGVMAALGSYHFGSIVLMNAA